MLLITKLIAVASTLAMLPNACQTSEVTNRKTFNIMPDGQMNEMGKQAFTEIKKSEKIESNSNIRNDIIEIGKAIATASGANLEWEFEVIESKEVNAFCLPGGKIAVYTGILPVAENNAALAAVLGHEVAHAVLKHSSERASQVLVTQMGLTLASISFQDSTHRDLLLGLMGAGAQVGVILPFSRKHESEADTIGLQYMAKAGYDPNEAPKLWTRMAKLGGGAPVLLSTHPDPAKRAEALQAQIASVSASYNSSTKVPTKALAKK